MPNDEITTNTLLNRLSRTSSLNRFIKRYDGEMENTPVFTEYITALCEEKKITPESVIKKSDIERTYGHKLFNGSRNPTRDRVIQLAFGFGMNYDEAQRFLAISQESALYAKIKRDAVIIFALKNNYNIEAVQSALFDFSLPLLGKVR